MTILSQPRLLDQARELVAVARERGAQPRIHPNGFLQLDLKPPESESWHEGKQAGHSGADLRLHIWNPPDHELPHQDTVNEVHDHVFDMRSTVVRGRLTQRLYEFVVGGTRMVGPGGSEAHVRSHEIYRAVYDKTSSSRLEPLGVQGVLRHLTDRLVIAGEGYTQPAFTLHDSLPNDHGHINSGLVVTLMEKVAVREGIPTVVCPIGQPPDNDFDRATAAPQDYLWSAIEASLA